MFLRQLSLKNIRSLKDLTIDFSSPDSKEVRQWTCLLGENGCGKSTVLRAAALLTAGSDALAELVGDVDRWIRNGAAAGRIDGVIETQSGEQRVVGLELKRGMNTADLLSHNSANLTAIDAALEHSLRNYFVVGYGVSRRLASKEGAFNKSEVFRKLRSQAVGTLFSGDAVLRPLDSWAMDLEYRKGKRGSAVIRRATKGLLPDVTVHRVDRERRQLIFRTPDGMVPLEELSDGYQNVAAWCGDLLYRITEVFKNYKNPLLARGLILLDEVDLHLHPFWQRTLVATLRDRLRNFQFLTTTHSPLTAQQAGRGELYILRRVNKVPALLHYEDAPNLLRVEQLIVSPVFGLETGVSTKVEALRKKEATGRKLAAKDVEVLRSVPRPRADPKTEKEKIALLRSVHEVLASAQPGPVRARSMAAMRRTRPAAFRPPAEEIIRTRVRPGADETIRAALKRKS
jgi:hypothetical protein